MGKFWLSATQGRGAPGMPDTYALLATIVGMGLEGKLAVVTDGRFSGFARG